jgi:hypothetical protein
MSRFVKDETDAIDLGGGDSIQIRRRMSYGQQRALSSLMAGKDQAVATSEYLVAVLEQNIVRWDGPGFQNGSGPVPITRQAIDSLDPEVAARLINEIAVRNGVKSDSFTPTATGSSEPSPDTGAGSPRSTPSSGSASDSAGPGTN